MDRSDSSVCPECGAAACQEKYGEILALEFENPPIFGAVHHITVTCYNLQHTSTFTDEAIAWMRSSLRAVIIDGLSAAELREQVRKISKAGMRVKRHTTLPVKPARTQWSMTVADIRTESPDVYREDIVAWAKSILKDLKIE